MCTLESNEKYTNYFPCQWVLAWCKLDVYYLGSLSCTAFLPTYALWKEPEIYKQCSCRTILAFCERVWSDLFTFLLALIGWIIFRAENIGQAWDYLGRMCSSSLLDISIRWGKSALLYIVLLVIVEWFQRDKQHALQITGKGILLYTPVRWIIYFTIILFILLFAGGQTDFIYFQF
mgnify:CR=1 FL=1